MLTRTTLCLAKMLGTGVHLTRRRGMDQVELRQKNLVLKQPQCIALDERVWVVGLRVYVHSCHIEPGRSVPISGHASTTVKIKQFHIASLSKRASLQAPFLARRSSKFSCSA